MLAIQTFETEAELEKWANYFRYHYLQESMTFEVFLSGMKKGYIAHRQYLEWDKVEGPHQQEEL